MSAPRTGSPFLFINLAIAGLLGAAVVGCTNEKATNPPSNAVNASDAAANTGAEASVGPQAGGTTAGTGAEGGPREMATANTEHAPNPEPEH